VPSSVFGFRATASLADLHLWFVRTVQQNAGLIVAAWLVLLAVVVCAAIGARRGWLRPQWRLAALAAGYSAGLNVMMVMANGAIAQRYLLPVELLLFAAVVALLLPGPGWPAGVPLMIFTVFLLGVSAVNYRWHNTYRAQAPVWTEQVAAAREMCRRDPALSQVVIRGGPQPFWSIVTVPCQVLLPRPPCPPPRCVYLDPPRQAVRRVGVAHG
jgi:hypothetical protein